jgi:hypothetical protein
MTLGQVWFVFDAAPLYRRGPTADDVGGDAFRTRG